MHTYYTIKHINVSICMYRGGGRRCRGRRAAARPGGRDETEGGRVFAAVINKSMIYIYIYISIHIVIYIYIYI